MSDDSPQGRPTDSDPYGATSPAKFFAVVTEAFTEHPACCAASEAARAARQARNRLPRAPPLWRSQPDYPGAPQATS
ncbi:MAG: zinc-dependent peptidase [Deltaproteobacteria bacterium]|nr:zinc-dependent peptidase [Deltaproteobacteria bacterium]